MFIRKLLNDWVRVSSVNASNLPACGMLLSQRCSEIHLKLQRIKCYFPLCDFLIILWKTGARHGLGCDKSDTLLPVFYTTVFVCLASPFV